MSGCCSARSPTTPRWSPSGTASGAGCASRGSSSITSCTPTMSGRSRTSSPGRIHVGVELAAGLGPGPPARAGGGRHLAPGRDARHRPRPDARSSSSAATRQSQTLADLAGRIVGTGAVDSPQATLLPLRLLRSAGLGRQRRAGARSTSASACTATTSAANGTRPAPSPPGGRRRLHDRRQPSPLRPRGSPARRRHPGHRTDPAVRPLQHDGRADCRRCPGRQVPRAAARHGLRRSRGSAAARPRRAQAVAARAACGL